MSLLSLVLLVLAVAAVAGAEWPRLARAAGLETGSGRSRGPGRARGPRRATQERRSSHLRVVEDPDGDADDFVQSVRRDLDRLPTFDRDADR